MASEWARALIGPRRKKLLVTFVPVLARATIERGPAPFGTKAPRSMNQLLSISRFWKYWPGPPSLTSPPVSKPARRSPDTILRMNWMFRPRVLSGPWLIDTGCQQFVKWLPSSLMLSQSYCPSTLPRQPLKSLLITSRNEAPVMRMADPFRPLLATLLNTQ